MVLCSAMVSCPICLLVSAGDEGVGDDDEELMDLDAEGGSEQQEEDELCDELCDDDVATGSKRKRNSSKVRTMRQANRGQLMLQSTVCGVQCAHVHLVSNVS